MNYCIMRIEKYKTAADVRGILKHNTREKMPENAEPSRSHLNEVSSTVDEAMKQYYKTRPKKIRKNGVHAIEVWMGASHAGIATPEYIARADEWAKKTFGAGNVLHIAHHLDETTPHSHILIMPMKDGQLNAKHFIGGTRYRLRELQDDFWEYAGKPFGLDRGQYREVTGARHDRPSLEKGLETKIKNFGEFAKKFESLMGMTPEDALKKDERFVKLLAMNPNDMVKAGCQTVGEFLDKKYQEKTKKQQQNRGISR